jgi:hypothetical protein
MTKRNLDWTESQVQNQRGKVMGLSRDGAGTEIHDEKLLRATRYGQRLAIQADAWNDLHDAAKKIHRTVNGTEWLPPMAGDPNGAKKRNRTLAQEEARAFLAMTKK